MSEASSTTVVDEEIRRMNHAVYRAVGRNVLLFQQLEGLLRHVVAYSEISGKPSELRTVTSRKARSLRNKGLGKVSDLYASGVLQTTGAEEMQQEHPESLIEPHVSITLRLALGHAEFRQKRKLLNDLVKQRNWLVHHSFLDWDPRSIASSAAFLSRLDAQFDGAKAELNSVRLFWNTAVQTAKGMLASKEMWDAVEHSSKNQ